MFLRKMFIGVKSLYCSLFLLLLIKDAVTQKKDWAYFGRRFNRPGDGNGLVPSQKIPGRQGDVKDESNGALYIPGKKDKVEKQSEKDSDKNRVNNDDNDKIVIEDLDPGFTVDPVQPGKDQLRPSDKNPVNNDDADKIVIEDLDPGFTVDPVQPGKDQLQPSDKNRVNNDDGDKIVIEDLDPGFTVNPVQPEKDQLSPTSYQKYHAEKISYTQDNMAMSWPLGIIPYYFDTTSYDHILASRVREVMDFLEGASCVQFKPLIEKPEKLHNWIHITNPTLERECVHRGMHQGNGEIRMVLGLDCLKRREILHTLLHAMGFMDEVSHPLRDQYIRVMWDNIQPKYQNLYSIAGGNSMLVEYDPMSVMHFHDRAFSKNGQATVVPLMPGLQIQPSDKLSQLDKMKLRLAFGHECNRRSVDHLLDTCKTVLHSEANGPSKKDEEETLSKFKSVQLKHERGTGSSKKKAQGSQATNDNTVESNGDPEITANEESQDTKEVTSKPDHPATQSSNEQSREAQATNSTTGKTSPDQTGVEELEETNTKRHPRRLG